MAQQAVETILIRQLADCLSVPVIVVSPEGIVVFYNEPAEKLLGIRYEESGRLTPEQFDERFEAVPEGHAADEGERPLRVALAERRPAHARRQVKRRADGATLHVEITAFPIIGQGGALHGAVAMFWEQPA